MSRSATPATRNEATTCLQPPKRTTSAELTIGTAIRGSRERLRTVADADATSSEHTLNPQTPRVKREPLPRIRESATTMRDSATAMGESATTMGDSATTFSHRNGRFSHHNGRFSHHNGRFSHRNGRFSHRNGRFSYHNGRFSYRFEIQLPQWGIQLAAAATMKIGNYN